MGDQLIGSRRTEEMVVKTWHPVKNTRVPIHYDGPVLAWLKDSTMQGRYCLPAGGVGAMARIYFECQEDAVLFELTWG